MYMIVMVLFLGSNLLGVGLFFGDICCKGLVCSVNSEHHESSGAYGV